MKGRSHHRLQSSDPPDDWVNGSWTVDCVCGVNFDDGEEMVNCDECGVWVHTRCSRYVKGDDIFVCDKCKIKNNRNDSEETEVAQLLVELPTKTMRIENSYAPNGPPRRPFRLWTDIPIEERVHVQGIPGGDPSLFGGLSSVFTPELWKCTGYVPKKFNFRYREFPCWDEKEGGDNKLDEENENPVDKGAGVLFSLSKESVFATPVAALVGLRGGDEEATRNRKVSLKEAKKWGSEGIDARRSENGGKKESSLVRPVVLHSGRRKKEDSGISKDRSGKKKARTTEKEVDAKKRVFTPTSDAKQLEFYEDRAPKFPKGEIQSTKNKNLKETTIKEPTSNPHLAAHGNVEKHSTEALSSNVSRQDFPIGTGLKEEKIDHQHPAVLESSPKEDDAVGSSVQRDNVKEEGDNMTVGKLDDSFESSDKNVDNSLVKDVPGVALEVKDNQVQDSYVDTSLKSELPNLEVKKELDHSSGSLPNIQSSPQGDAKDPGISLGKMLETSKLNSATISTSQSSDDKAEHLDRSLEAVGNSHMSKADQLSGEPCQLKSELESADGLMALQKTPSEQKKGSGIPEEHSRAGGTMLNSQGLPSQRNMVACSGKSSSMPTTVLTAKSSSSDNVKSTDASNHNPVAKPQITSESNANVRKDRCPHDVREEDRDDVPRKSVKERPKSILHSAPKPSHPSRISHDPLSKKTTPESKDNVLCVSSKTSSAANTTAVSSGSVEPTGSLHHQKAVHTHNRTTVSGVPPKGEKFNQPNIQPSSKINQNHTTSVCPPVLSSLPATLSDEELALLLHQELNSSPRVPRVPRVRHAGSLPQLSSPSATSMLIKRTSSSGGKDHSSVSRRKYRDAPRDGFRSSREVADEGKRKDRVPSSHDLNRQDTDDTAEASTKREENGSSAMESVKKNMPSTSAATNSGPSSSTEANERNMSSIRSSPRNTSDEDTGTVGGPIHRTLPGLINEIMSKGKRMTYEELCNAVLPHWHNLRKHNGERYAYTSHSQAVLDCLRNRHEWARLVDRGPKTNSSRKRRKLDADDSEDNEYGKGKTANQVDSKSLESQKEDFPKGKRKARKRRRLALQGRGVRDIRRRRKQELISDEDFGTSSNSSEDSMSSEDEIQGGGARPEGSEASVSSDETGTM
ncbi:dentin sialophosphoprotein isoform X2 [Morus notabilis]|uniref:dentin sialophosphoprotein isoform X2 n=1 Tax=Morus notabilis TaxID=981085 RepID=UPI000CED7B78|nr:dentin sialophosphoprotein isoform X2 [Morus notabilis]